MEKKKLVLAALAAANGDAHTPVQVQKLFFLIDREIADLVGGPHFDFTPYDYGPFDRKVYEALEILTTQGLVETIPEKTWKSFRLSPEGQRFGSEILSSLTKEAQDFIVKASEFVRSLTFQQLVAAIYKAYPEMRANSVFQE